MVKFSIFRRFPGQFLSVLGLLFGTLPGFHNFRRGFLAFIQWRGTTKIVRGSTDKWRCWSILRLNQHAKGILVLFFYMSGYTQTHTETHTQRERHRHTYDTAPVCSTHERRQATHVLRPPTCLLPDGRDSTMRPYTRYDVRCTNKTIHTIRRTMHDVHTFHAGLVDTAACASDRTSSKISIWGGALFLKVDFRTKRQCTHRNTARVG